MTTIAPRLNLNGSSKESLLIQNTTAADAIRTALNAATQAHPHGRDFQTLPHEVYRLAADASLLRIKALEELAKQYDEIAFAIFDQVGR